MFPYCFWHWTYKVAPRESMNISEIGWQCWRKLFELSAKLIWSCWMWFPWGSPHFCLLKMQAVLRQTLSLSNQLVTCTSAFFCQDMLTGNGRCQRLWQRLQAPAIRHDILWDLCDLTKTDYTKLNYGVYLHTVHERMSSWHSGPNADDDYVEVLGYPNTQRWWWWYIYYDEVSVCLCVTKNRHFLE